MHGNEPEESQGAIPEKGDTVSQTKIKVPEGMLLAASEFDPGAGEYNIEPILEAALRWMSENPIVPTSKQERDLVDSWIKETSLGKTEYLVTEWQRRMFIEPGVPEEVKDLLCAGDDIVKEAYFRPDIYNERIIEAYRRGQKTSS